jgi:hypothetical protein
LILTSTSFINIHYLHIFSYIITGVLPDKIPFVSERVKVRVPTADDILKMLSDQEEMLMIQDENNKKDKKRKERGEADENKDQE